MTGKSCKVSRIKVIDPPTIGISVSGLYSKIKDVTIMGGRITHGAGTKNFGIYLDGNAKFSKITGLTVEANGLGGMVYDAIFNSGASDCEFIDNPIGQTLEHAIYNYGDRCIIGQNLIDGLNSSASAIQVFAEGCTISNNTIKNNKSGGIGLQKGSNTSIIDNKIFDCANSGISYRTFYGSTSDYVMKNLLIARNLIIMDTTSVRQSPIDVRPTYAIDGLKIIENVVNGSDKYQVTYND